MSVCLTKFEDLRSLLVELLSQGTALTRRRFHCQCFDFRVRLERTPKRTKLFIRPPKLRRGCRGRAANPAALSQTAILSREFQVLDGTSSQTHSQVSALAVGEERFSKP